MIKNIGTTRSSALSFPRSPFTHSFVSICISFFIVIILHFRRLRHVQYWRSSETGKFPFGWITLIKVFITLCDWFKKNSRHIQSPPFPPIRRSQSHAFLFSRALRWLRALVSFSYWFIALFKFVVIGRFGFGFCHSVKNRSTLQPLFLLNRRSFVKRAIRHYPKVQEMLQYASECAVCGQSFLNTWLECVHFVDAHKVR